MAEESNTVKEENLSEMRETISQLQSELDKVKGELSELKTTKTVEAPAPSETKVSEPSEPKEEEKEAEKPPEEELDTQEQIVEHLKKIPGVGVVMAEKIYEAGYTTHAQLRELTVEELSEVKGIGPSVAKKIVEGLKKIEEGKEAELLKKEAAPPPKPPEEGITQKTFGFIKGTYSKIKGFLFKAPPKKKEGDVVEKPKPPEEKPAESVEVTGAPGEETKPSEPSEEKEKEPTPPKEEEEAPETSPAAQPIEETPPTTPAVTARDTVIESFNKIPGVDSTLAGILYDAGYGSLEELKEAEVEDLTMIEGINAEVANNICTGLKSV